MLDHVEIVFENMKPMMKKLKKKNYNRLRSTKSS